MWSNTPLVTIFTKSSRINDRKGIFAGNTSLITMMYLIIKWIRKSGHLLNTLLQKSSIKSFCSWNGISSSCTSVSSFKPESTNDKRSLLFTFSLQITRFRRPLKFVIVPNIPSWLKSESGVSSRWLTLYAKPSAIKEVMILFSADSVQSMTGWIMPKTCKCEQFWTIVVMEATMLFFQK